MYSCRLVTATHCTKTTGPIDIHVPFELCTQVGPSHLTYVATLPCNLSLMACFADINVSQGSVATCARCGRIFLYAFSCKFTKETYSEKIL